MLIPLRLCFGNFEQGTISIFSPTLVPVGGTSVKIAIYITLTLLQQTGIVKHIPGPLSSALCKNWDFRVGYSGTCIHNLVQYKYGTFQKLSHFTRLSFHSPSLGRTRYLTRYLTNL